MCKAQLEILRFKSRAEGAPGTSQPPAHSSEAEFRKQLLLQAPANKAGDTWYPGWTSLPDSNFCS